jgi:hypothetical protein
VHLGLEVTWLRVHEQSDQLKTGYINVRIISKLPLQIKDLKNNFRNYQIPQSTKLSQISPNFKHS